jgi:DNA-binding response OmpR family regulator
MTPEPKQLKKSIQSVVLADDDSDDSFLFNSVFDEMVPAPGLTVVRDGNELLSLLNNFVPDLLFLDLEMPYKNGLECLVEIRNSEVLKTLPVVVFSSTTRPANIQTAYEMGADLFFIKPSIFSDLSTAIKTILSFDWSDPASIKEQYSVNGRYTAFA